MLILRRFFGIMANLQSDRLKRVGTKTRQLILQYQKLQSKNNELLEQVNTLTERLSKAKEEAKDWKIKYNSLVCAKTLEPSEEEAKKLRNRMSKLEREVENCITLLNEW